MFVALRLITLPADGGDPGALASRLHEVGSRFPGVRSSWAGETIGAMTMNGCDVVWRLQFDSEVDALAVRRERGWMTDVAPLLSGSETWSFGYPVIRSSVTKAGAGIWRALLFRVVPAGFPSIPKLEEQALLVAKHVSTIRSWGLNAVTHVEAPKAFTHVWEQEFDSAAGMAGEYMRHPVHWGVGDSWFDPDSPNCIVDQHISIITGTIDMTIMS